MMEKMVSYGRILMSKHVVTKYAISFHLCSQILDAWIFKQSGYNNRIRHMDILRIMKNSPLALRKLLYSSKRLFCMGCCPKKHESSIL
jgi:hypothetical protein